MTVSRGSKSHSQENPKPGGRPLLWLNVLCLDAPLVALSWQLLFARTLGVHPRTAECAALFLTAWVIYLLDRFVDSGGLRDESARSMRAAFCLRHRKWWLPLIILVSGLDAVVVFTGLTRATVVHGMLLGVVAAVYLMLNFAFSRVWHFVPLKEVAVGFLFATGTLLVLVPGGQSYPPGFWPAAFLFGCVCSLNCMSIALWEKNLDEEQKKHSLATTLKRPARSVRFAAVGVALVCLFLGPVFPQLWPVTACLALSAVCLIALEIARVPRDERTALADLVLLTPLLFLAIDRLP